MKSVVKAGTLANGFERKRGIVVHVVDSEKPYLEWSLCKVRPKNQWSVVADEVNCPKCLKAMGKL